MAATQEQTHKSRHGYTRAEGAQPTVTVPHSPPQSDEGYRVGVPACQPDTEHRHVSPTRNRAAKAFDMWRLECAEGCARSERGGCARSERGGCPLERVATNICCIHAAARGGCPSSLGCPSSFKEDAPWKGWPSRGWGKQVSAEREREWFSGKAGFCSSAAL